MKIRSLLSQAPLLFLAVKLLADAVYCQKHYKNQRRKRDWVIPAVKLVENVDYTKYPFITQIGSDVGDNLRYTLKGPGADQPPYNLFVVDEKTGKVQITGILDREDISSYKLVGVAWYRNNTIAEEAINLPFEVGDQNDNPPVFMKPQPASVYEGSPVGTFVTTVNATDADLPNSAHTKIAFSIIKQEPDGKQFFSIDKHSGHISVKDSSLDRETQNSYVLTVKATDMDGAPDGNTATTTVNIHVLDINDNMPTLEKDEYTVSVDEHVADVEVLRIQSLDKDEERTDNWLTVFQLVSGNEDGYFSIITDPDTNEGVLYLIKPIDFETVTNLDLGLVLENKAPARAAAGMGSGSGTSAGTLGVGDTGGRPIRPGSGGTGTSLIKHKIYMIRVSVINRPDGPKYRPSPKVVPVSEKTKGSSMPRVIATYPAMDGDTGKPAEKVRYAKGYDPANWLSIDESTSEIKLNKIPDRESPYVVNGTYYAKILCITDDMPSQTATGTIALEVEDVNDNCPTLLSTLQRVCSDVPEVNVAAVDADAHPNGAPLQFLVIPEETTGKWNVKMKSDEAAVLIPQESLWPGSYKVTMEIKDQQGLACPDKQVLQIEVCTCSEEGTCSHSRAVKTAATASFGALGIGFLLLGVLILLLVPVLLLSCSCGMSNGGVGFPQYFNDMPFDRKEYLIAYHTEGPGEDREVPLLSAPLLILLPEGERVQAGNVSSNMAVHMNSQAPATVGVFGGYDYAQTGAMEMAYNTSRDDNFQYLRASDMALSDQFLQRYFTQKARHEAENEQLKEALLLCSYEGQGSTASSVTCDSLLESFDDLEFLDDLGPKFTTLAQICGLACPELELESKATFEKAREIACERSDVVSSSHTMETENEIIVESPPAPILMSENSSMQGQMFVVQEPLYYMVEQVPPTVLLAGQASVELGQGMYLVNGMSGAEGIILNQSYHAEKNPSYDQQGALSGNSEKNITITSQHPNSTKVLCHRGLGWMHQGSFSGETVSEAVITTSGHSVVVHTSGLNNGTLLKGEQVVIMETVPGQRHVILGEATTGLNQTLVQNISPTQNFIMMPGQD
ncbi:desmoglein-2-like [Pygocentrus nattereri]|uniref:Desmoglein 2 n=1 Tax=Pygocentrus nattereri TaxID=42514 RepID=A0A3B4DDH9_PYGNA|nr:desmoglein-2-like [Pygocentrus nattereri]